MTQRKLVTIKTITNIEPIPDADAIEVVTVDHGWKVVVKKEDNYRINDKVLYFEVDSWVPHRIAPFLSNGHEPREYEGVKGERLRTIKLRGQISQGLVLKFRKQNPALSSPWSMEGDLIFIHPESEEHLAETLNVKKWEPPIPTQLAGNVEGKFPSFVYKTDQERCQNLYNEIFLEHIAEEYEVTEKLEGSSMTVFYKDGEFGVCSRNWNLKDEGDNTFWAVAKKLNLLQCLNQLGRNIALQGELIGPGVQKNYYNLKEHLFMLFDIFDIDKAEYLRPEERHEVNKYLNIPHVPIIASSMKLEFNCVDDLLKFAEGKSASVNREREGLVFKSHHSSFSFKAISNKYLLKQ